MIGLRDLGPVQIFRDGTPVPLTAPMLRRILVLLVCRAGRPQPAATLADLLWDRPPKTARKTLHVYVHRLRRVIGPDLISHRPTGYTLAADLVDLDSRRFVHHIESAEQARGRGELEIAVANLEAALTLWRGAPYADADDIDGVVQQAGALTDRYLDAHEMLLAVELDRGRPIEVARRAESLVAQHPFRERLAAFQMLGLLRSGRQADAIAAFIRTRDILADQLGIEPGPLLQHLHLSILRRESWVHTASADIAIDASHQIGTGPTRSTAASSAPARATTVPAQLPLRLAQFHGRQAQLARLDTLVAGGDAKPLLVTVVGMPGIGKTTLAVHWAHRVAEHFPDGQLYVNLRGFDPDDAPRDPGDVLHEFLDALGVVASRIPGTTSARAALFRSLTANRHQLVILDNAANADQVRPLLPGGAGCRTVVTSRNQLRGLTASTGGDTLTLPLFDSATAREMLAGRLGDNRVLESAHAIDAILAHCAGLPLALAAVTATALAQPDTALSTIAHQLAQAATALNPIADGDLATDLRVSLTWSYGALTAEAAQSFRLLALAPGPDITAPAIASLIGLPLQQTHGLVAELRNANLLSCLTAGRYSQHDLIRLFAAELTAARDDEPTRRDAIRRLLDFYLTAAYQAATTLHPHRTLSHPPAPAVLPQPSDSEHAMAWLASERHTLLASVTAAHNLGLHTHVWQLAWSLAASLARQGRDAENVAIHRLALRSARQLGDPEAQMHAHLGLALTLVPDADSHRRSLPEDSRRSVLRHATTAVRLSHRLPPRDTAWCEFSLGNTYGDLHDYDQALSHTRTSLELYKSVGDQAGQARALHHLGWYHALAGHDDNASTYCRQAIELFTAIDDNSGIAPAWHSLGYIHQQAGRYNDAIACYRRAATLHTHQGNLGQLCMTEIDMAESYLANGQPTQAIRAWRAAIKLMEQLGHHSDADQIRQRIQQTIPSDAEGST